MNSCKPRLHVAATGAANLASVGAMCKRAGVEAIVTSDPEALYSAEKALLPGVGAFGAAMSALRAKGLDKALLARAKEGKPTMGICLGMQMLCAGSEESPGVPGIGLLSSKVGRFRVELPLPQLGWNRVSPALGPTLLKAGWAYFANSYRVKDCPLGLKAAESSYGENFVAALEAYKEGEALPFLLLCQFHPELSGPWGLDLFRRWMGLETLEARP
ncbi:MAG: imidazole glycerol phosphate synthase subunit HisH [Spirochaetes bacterium]|nr:imidazole glycerol phosphate synthase subunit HisH [Spirochaetota bacterium]